MAPKHIKEPKKKSGPPPSKTAPKGGPLDKMFKLNNP